jgi:hypothetical protein
MNLLVRAMRVSAAERKVLVMCALASTLLCLLPGERVVAIVIGTMGAVVLVVHLLLARAERRARLVAPPLAVPPAAGAALPESADAPAGLAVGAPSEPGR